MVRLAACLDIDESVLASGTVPSLWHWACFQSSVRTADLGEDGHPQRRAAMAAFPRRMWVGGRVHIREVMRIGETAIRRSELIRAEEKDGSSGRFWLLTVGHRISQRSTISIEEEQDLVLRSAGAVPSPATPRIEAPRATWVEETRIDPVLLFRFSAATSNAHRIHYDYPYATSR